MDYIFETIRLAFWVSPSLLLAIAMLLFLLKMTQNSGTKLNGKLNKTIHGYQNVTYNFQDLKKCEKLEVVRRKHNTQTGKHCGGKTYALLSILL